jgi:hypothetical protein
MVKPLDPSATSLSARVQHLRGNAPQRGRSVRVLAAFAGHTDCPLATLGFAAGVNFDQVLGGTRYAPRFGQSPFAFARGHQFEALLRRGGHAAFLGLLEAERGGPLAAPRVVNLRDGTPIEARAARAEELLRRLVRGSADVPHLIDGLVLAATVGGEPAHFEADALATCLGGQAHVAEVKSFPRVDDRIDPDRLAAAVDQAALYIELLRRALDRLGGDGERLVSDRALLVTPRNVGLTPVLSGLDVGRRVGRARTLLASLPSTTEVIASAPAGASFGPIANRGAPEDRRVALLHDLADGVGTAYKPACLADCGNAFFCRERAFRAGSPCVVGPSAVRLLPGVGSLGRAAELTRGAVPEPEEAAAGALLAEAGGLLDALAAPIVP